MATNPGVGILAEIRPYDSADTFNTFRANEGRGGYHVVADNTARDALSANVERRAEGMLAYVTGTGLFWRLGSDLTSWVAYPADASITNAKLATVATATFKGRTTAATGAVEDLNATQATALLNAFGGTVKGLVPSSDGSGPTSNFLRKDGSWGIPGIAGLSGTTDITFPLTDTLTDRNANFSFSTAITDTGHSFTSLGIGLKVDNSGILPTEDLFGDKYFGWGLVMERGFINASGNYQHEIYTTTAASERTFFGGTSPAGTWTASVASGIVTTSAAHSLVVGQRFDFSAITGGSGGIAVNTFYWVQAVTDSTHFRYALTAGGAAVSAHNASSGTVRIGGFGGVGVGGISVTTDSPASLTVYSTDYSNRANEVAEGIRFYHSLTGAAAAQIYATFSAPSGKGQIGLWTNYATNGGQIYGYDTLGSETGMLLVSTAGKFLFSDPGGAMAVTIVPTGITTPLTTFNLVNTTATTVNFAGGATVALNIGNAGAPITAVGGLAIPAGKNISLDTVTGTKLGTAATQKIGLWNTTPVVQPATTGTTTGFTAGAGSAVLSDSTFTGGTGSKAYTVGDIVLALKQAGVMAAT